MCQKEDGGEGAVEAVHDVAQAGEAAAAGSAGSLFFEGDAFAEVLVGERGAIALAGQDVGGGGEAGQRLLVGTLSTGSLIGVLRYWGRSGMRPYQRDVVAGEHGADGGGVALGKPEALGVFVDDEGVAIRVGAALRKPQWAKGSIAERVAAWQRLVQ